VRIHDDSGVVNGVCARADSLAGGKRREEKSEDRDFKMIHFWLAKDNAEILYG